MINLPLPIVEIIILICIMLSMFYISADLIILDGEIKSERISRRKALFSVLLAFLKAFFVLLLVALFVIFLVERFS